MPTLAGPPLRKITLNLYEDDCEIFERHYGRGWTTAVRDVVGDHAAFIRRSTIQPLKPRPTLGDLDNG